MTNQDEIIEITANDGSTLKCELFDMVSECNDGVIEQKEKLETFFDEISDPLTNRQEQENKKKNGLLSMFMQMFTRKLQSSVS